MFGIPLRVLENLGAECSHVFLPYLFFLLLLLLFVRVVGRAAK